MSIIKRKLRWIGNKICLVLIGALFLSLRCSANNTPINPTTLNFEVEMELTKDYDDLDPFIDERLFYVTDDVDTLKLDISLELNGESGTLEIADNNTEEVLWRDNWNGSMENTTFTTSLHSLQKEKEYVIRFTGTKIEYAKVIILSESASIKERTKPLKQLTTESDKRTKNEKLRKSFLEFLFSHVRTWIELEANR